MNGGLYLHRCLVDLLLTDPQRITQGEEVSWLVCHMVLFYHILITLCLYCLL